VVKKLFVIVFYKSQGYCWATSSFVITNQSIYNFPVMLKYSQYLSLFIILKPWKEPDLDQAKVEGDHYGLWKSEAWFDLQDDVD